MSDADAALEFLKDTSISQSVDERKLVRKIDWMIVPLMWLCYNLQYLDKTLVNYAAVSASYNTAVAASYYGQGSLRSFRCRSWACIKIQASRRTSFHC